MDINKLRKKHKRYSFLQTLCYLLGFPLLILLVFFGSTKMLYGDAFVQTRLYGLAVVGALWLVVSILQLIVCIFSKNKNTRSLWAMVFAIIFVIGGAFAFDIYAEKQIVAVQKEYAGHKGVVVKDYKYQINYYNTITSNKSDLTDEYNKMVADFCTVYNVDVVSKCFNDKINADGSKVVYDKKADAYYSPNGMYADGFVFNMEQAVDILITINQTRADYAKKGKDADVELQKALDKAKISSAWTTYTNTAEYKAAYGANGTAYNHMLTMDKLDNVLSILGEHLDGFLDGMLGGVIKGVVPEDLKFLLDYVNEDLTIEVLCDAINTLEVGKLLSLVEGYIEGIDEDLVAVVYDALLPIINYVTSDTYTEAMLKADGFTLLDLLNAIDFDKMEAIASNFGLDLADFEDVFQNGLTPALVEDLIMSIPLTSNLFFYQSPTTKPLMSFIEDADLKEYAYAKYYASTHGANVGSVLLGDNLGAVTFSSSGHPSSAFAYDLTQLYQLKASNSYIPKYYPLFAARRYMYVCGGVIMIMMALYYHNARKKEQIFALIAKGGNR